MLAMPVLCISAIFYPPQASGRTGNKINNLEAFLGSGLVFYYLTYKSNFAKLKLNALFWGIYDISFKKLL